MMTASRRADVDGGWAWCVLAASYFNQLVCSGLAFVAGMFQVIFLEQFQESVALTSWVTCMFSSLQQLGGPLSSVVANSFGCRTSVMLGGCCLSMGFLLSGFVNSLGALFVTFGMIAGSGLGLTYTASIVIISFYFEKRRHLVNGIAASAGGLGILLGPQISQTLFDNMNWREAVFILAGISLHVVLAGALLFPTHEKMKGCCVGDFNKLCHKRHGGNKHDGCDNETAAESHDACTELLGFPDEISSNTTEYSPPSYDKILCATDHSVPKSTIDHRDNVETKELKLYNIHSDPSTVSYDKKMNDTDIRGIDYEKEREQSSDLTDSISSRYSSSVIKQGSALDKTFEQQLVQQLPEKCLDIEFEIAKTSTQDDRHHPSSLSTNRVFLVLCLAQVLNNAGISMFLIHAASYMKAEGLDERDVSVVLSMNGVAILIGRCIVGALVNKNPGFELIFLIVMTLIGGVTLCLLPVLGTGYPSCIVIMLAIGFFNGSGSVIFPTLTIRYVGLDRLVTAFGIEMVSCGIGFLISPPFAGMLVDWTHSYDYNMYCGGTIVIISGFVMSILPWLEKRHGLSNS